MENTSIKEFIKSVVRRDIEADYSDERVDLSAPFANSITHPELLERDISQAVLEERRNSDFYSRYN